MKQKVSKIKHICEICHATFWCYPSQDKNRTVCSMRCYREKQEKARVQVTCTQCGKIFSRVKSLVKDGYNFCSKKCFNKHKSEQMIIDGFKKHNKLRSGVSISIEDVLNKKVTKCLQCGHEFLRTNWKQKFCSNECANDYKKAHRKLQNKVCEICGREFTCKSNKKGRFCSHKCQWEAQSRGLVKSYSYGNYGYREDLQKTFRSSLEANFARVCNYLKLTWPYEPKCFYTSLGRYTPDFYIKEWDSFVETRGYKKRSLEKAKLASETHGFKLKIIFEQDFLNEYGSLKEKIPHWETSDKITKSKFNPEVYEKKICLGCGQSFVVRKSQTNKKIYCSQSCANKHKWENNSKKHFTKHHLEERHCLYCNTVFKCVDNDTKKYCSRKCYWEDMRNAL